MKKLPLRCFTLISILILAAVNPSNAADPLMGSAPAIALPSTPDIDAIAALEDHLDRLAVLQLLRVAFDVIPESSAAEVLESETARLAENGPTASEVRVLDLELLTETSYYIVSLRYLIQSGGALWPNDRPERTYVNDALAELNAAQLELLEVIAARGDPLPLLQRINRVHAWTESYSDIPSDLDFFVTRDAIVSAALKLEGGRSAT